MHPIIITVAKEIVKNVVIPMVIGVVVDKATGGKKK